MEELTTPNELDVYIARNGIETYRQELKDTVRFMARYADDHSEVSSSRATAKFEINNSLLNLEFLMKRQAVENLVTSTWQTQREVIKL